MLKPYYETKLGKLYCGDSLEIIPQLINEGVLVDLIVTDPPYAMNFKSGRRKVSYDSISNDNNTDWVQEYIKLSYEILKDNSHFYSFISYHKIDTFKIYIEERFKLKNLLVWVKNNHGSGDLKGSYAPQHEMIFFAHKGRKLLNDKRDSDILYFKKTGNKLHPTEKPVDLIEYLISKSSQENDLVLDCFSGSGTTAIACENTGRKWICIEKDEGYFKIGINRINNL